MDIRGTGDYATQRPIPKNMDGNLRLVGAYICSQRLQMKPRDYNALQRHTEAYI